MTIEAPKTNCVEGAASPRTSHDTNVDMTIDSDVAKPFKILSAYFMVTDTIKPPNA